MSEPLREITRLINVHAFGEASPGTRSALDVVVQKDAASQDVDEPVSEEKEGSH